MSAVTSASLCWVLLSVCLLSVSADQKNIIAVPGQTVTLPCRAPNNNYPVLVVEWSRADLETEYVLFYRDEKLDPEEQHPSFKDRVDLQDRRMKDGDASLVLKDVAVNDTGTYECHVVQRGTNRRTRASLDGDPISTIYLSVVAPEQKNITAKSGQNVTLTCRAPNHILIPGVEWSRRDLETQYVLWYWEKQFVPYYQHPSFKNRVGLQDRHMKDGDLSLVLNNVTAADNGTYECCISQEVRDGRKSIVFKSEPISIIHLKVLSPGARDVHVESDRNAHLECHGPENAKLVLLEWKRRDLLSDGYVFFYQDDRLHKSFQHPV
ncbi:matrix remodeling-associated protein 8-like [Archocentrus centrarchus]|uniref:matrix remodeling-associated protein 8-like n=1 Tax=Archocentrus centrarchus TaxID=63155 RepID=UPI0011EA02A8|nr:matrix remodeling-associated protein 8-like [Archocentrus centrarchus]XP_030580111.1 matrix remodeling-associated protein 8-like [Archocentrus centrarchus]